MPDLSVDIERDESGYKTVCAKFSDNDWELNVRAPRSRFSALRSIRTQDWNSRSVVAVGVSAGADVFWSSDGATATIMVGQDDETWDVAVTVHVELVEDHVCRVEAL